MAYNHVRVGVLTVMLIMAVGQVFAADELFDTASATKHMQQGFSYLNARNYDAAIHEFEESTAINPEAEAYYYLGYAYYLKSRKVDGKSRVKSRENFEKAYEIDPHFTPTRYQPAEPAPEPITRPSQTALPDEAQPAAPEPATLQSTTTAQPGP
jgi:tetratricopeptide (TPR) repeat protein